MNISSYFCPFSNKFHSIEDFKTLSFGKKFLTITATALASLLLPGIGGVAVFRLLVGRFKPVDLSDTNRKFTEAENVSGRVNEIGLKKFSNTNNNLSKTLLTYQDFNEKRGKISLDGTTYKIDAADDAEDYPWIQYKAEGSNSSINKVHISILQEEENITKVFEIIFPLLIKQKISCFKIIKLNNINIDDSTNLNGKEFVIYFNKNEQEKAPQFLMEIEQKLKSSEIKRGNYPISDIPILNERFIFTRSDNNIFYKYISAKNLKSLGFNNKEAALISPNLFKDLEPVENESEDQNRFLDKDLTVLNDISFSQITKQYFDDFEAKDDPLFLLITGKHRQLSDYASSEMIPFLNLLFKVEGRLSLNKIYQCNFDHSPLIDSLTPHLNKAAKITMQILSLQEFISDINLDSLTIGRIFPAIYHQFMVPIKNRGSQSMELSPEEAKRFVTEIIRCSLRDRENLESFIIDINDTEINYLIENFYDELISHGVCE